MTSSKIDLSLKQPGFNFSSSSVIIFVVAAATGWSIHILGEITFPSFNLIPFVVRTTLTLALIFGMIKLTFYLLVRNGLSPVLLGLHLSRETLLNVLSGVAIGIITIGLMTALIYLFIPYHFVAGPLGAGDMLKTGYSYFMGNFLEELIFRGFLLIIISQLTSWRKAVWIMALPFGLFHLPGLGLTRTGLEMVVTTAIYSFIFSYAYLLTGSLWTAVSVHLTSNLLLHTFLGLDGAGKSVYIPVLDAKWSGNYNPYFIAFLIASVAVAASLFLFINRRNKPKTKLF